MLRVGLHQLCFIEGRKVAIRKCAISWTIQSGREHQWSEHWVNACVFNIKINVCIPSERPKRVAKPGPRPCEPNGRKVTAPAYELHRSVPADRWCVTYLDLLFLSARDPICPRCSEIHAGPEDDASKDYRPGIYTMNEQYRHRMRER